MLSDAPSGIVSGGAGITEPFFSSYEEIGLSESHILWRARRFGRWYVLKGLREEFRGNPVYEEWLYKEYSIGVGLDSPYVVRVESLEDDAIAGRCIVMEWVDGKPLDQWKKGRRKAELKRVFDQLLDAIDYLHSRGICHRDIKPSNIIVTADGRVKLIDFGLSDGPQYATLKQASGTENYASPEQREGRATDNRSDIYSLGRVMEFLFGKRYSVALRRTTRPNPDRRPQSVASLRRLMFPTWPVWVLGVVMALILFALTLLPSSKRFEVQLESGQTVWMREVSRVPQRLVEVVPPSSDQWAPWPKGTAKPEGDMVIPASVHHLGLTWQVVAIANRAFKDDAKLTSVKLPETLRSIGDEAFVGCISLRDTLVIPYGLQQMGIMPFNDCTSLTTLIWKARDCQGAHHDSIMKYSYFFRCMALANVIIDTDVEQLPVDFVSNVAGLKRIEFKGDTRIAVHNLAAKSHQMRQLVLSPQMREIGHGAFYETAIDTLVLSDSLEIVGDYAFAYCDSLQVVYMGPKVRKVGNYSFTECSHLREVRILATVPPEAVKTTFYQLPPTAVLRVPANAVEAYRNHPIWGTFKRIEAIPQP